MLCTLGSSCFCTRGVNPEAKSDGAHYPRTFVLGIYNRLETKIADKVSRNEDLANIPTWLSLNFCVEGGEWFNLRDFEILCYRQELDMREGVLRRMVHCRDPQGRESRLMERRFVYLSEHPHRVPGSHNGPFPKKKGSFWMEAN